MMYPVAISNFSPLMAPISLNDRLEAIDFILHFTSRKRDLQREWWAGPDLYQNGFKSV
jgi:hypothetical protein